MDEMTRLMPTEVSASSPGDSELSAGLPLMARSDGMEVMRDRPDRSDREGFHSRLTDLPGAGGGG